MVSAAGVLKFLNRVDANIREPLRDRGRHPFHVDERLREGGERLPTQPIDFATTHFTVISTAEAAGTGTVMVVPVRVSV